MWESVHFYERAEIGATSVDNCILHFLFFLGVFFFFFPLGIFSGMLIGIQTLSECLLLEKEQSM